jgi:hypothetical protein
VGTSDPTYLLPSWDHEGQDLACIISKLVDERLNFKRDLPEARKELEAVAKNQETNHEYQMEKAEASCHPAVAVTS